MIFLESLNLIKAYKFEEVSMQHILKALNKGFAEITPHIQYNATSDVIVECYGVDITDDGREFIRTVEEATRG